MDILLDTHAVIWLLEGSDKLSPVAKKEIENLENQIFVSVISLFEIAIKVKVGKLGFTQAIPDIVKELDNQAIQLLPLTDLHISSYHAVPLYPEHRDPFDRILIATAMNQGFSIITIDEKFDNYKNIIDIIW